MNLSAHPHLLDQLAQRYAFGVMRGGARQRLKTLAQRNAVVRTSVQAWQHQADALLVLPTQPQAVSAGLWPRIEASVALTNTSAQASAQTPVAMPAIAPKQPWLSFWRGLGLLGAVASVGALALLLRTQTQLGDAQLALASVSAKAQSQAQRIEADALEKARLQQVNALAVLADDKSGLALLVTWDEQKQRLKVQRLGAYQEAADRSLQLWAIQTTGAPRSLGLVGSTAAQALEVLANRLESTQVLAVSVEPKGGVPEAGGPTGPVLFKGALIRTQL